MDALSQYADYLDSVPQNDFELAQSALQGLPLSTVDETEAERIYLFRNGGDHHSSANTEAPQVKIPRCRAHPCRHAGASPFDPHLFRIRR